MSLAENIVKEQVTQTASSYRTRVRWMAVIYLVLNSMSLAIIVAVVWRVQYFITLTQRTNVETLTLAIIFILALYYLVSTAKGFVGALRLIRYHIPSTLARDEEARLRVEKQKHNALMVGGKTKSAFFDRAVRLQDNLDEPIKWTVGDDAGVLGTLVLDGVKASFEPKKDGISNSIFEFLATKIGQIMQQDDPNADLQVTQWSTIDQDAASAYFSTVLAFQNLEKQLGARHAIWPTVEITGADVATIGDELRKLAPALRSEAFLPDLEYAVEYNVPILPEPLGFMKLTRSDNRADPLITMGCAGIIMLFVIGLLVFFVIFPPWIPAR